MAEKLLNDEFLRRLETLHLASRRIIRGRTKGERLSKRRGYSSEFADYRNYVEGDDLRFIDWNIYGRLDKLFLKLFLEEEDLHVHILLDASLSMGFGTPPKLDYAKRVAAAIAYVGLANTDRVEIRSFSAAPRAGTGSLRGKTSAWKAFAFLEELRPEGETSLDAACRAFGMRAGGGAGVAVLLSDFLDPAGYEPALRRLLSRSLDVHVIHLLAPEEIRPALKGDLRLVDVEDASEQEITVSQPLLRQYDETLKRFCGGLRDQCTRRGMSYTFSSTETPFDRLVLSALRGSGLFG